MLSWLGFRRGATEQAILERRVYERHQLSPHSACRVIVTMGHGSRPALIVDLSLGGIGFLYHQPLERGKLIIAQLTNSARSFSKLLPLSVVHLEKHTDGKHLVGCEFKHRLSMEDLSALLE